MASDKEMIKTLFKIASRQQKIIEKLAQQVAGKADVNAFNELLSRIITRSGKGSACKVTSAEALSDGSYDLRLTGALVKEDMDAFKQQAASKWTDGDVGKLRIIRDMQM